MRLSLIFVVFVVMGSLLGEAQSRMVFVETVSFQPELKSRRVVPTMESGGEATHQEIVLNNLLSEIDQNCPRKQVSGEFRWRSDCVFDQIRNKYRSIFLIFPEWDVEAKKWDDDNDWSKFRSLLNRAATKDKQGLWVDAEALVKWVDVIAQTNALFQAYDDDQDERLDSAEFQHLFRQKPSALRRLMGSFDEESILFSIDKGRLPMSSTEKLEFDLSRASRPAELKEWRRFEVWYGLMVLEGQLTR